MIQLHITIYVDPNTNEDRFKVFEIGEEPIDVTEKYDVVAASMPDGRKGFTVLQKCQFTVHDIDCGCEDGR